MGIISEWRVKVNSWTEPGNESYACILGFYPRDFGYVLGSQNVWENKIGNCEKGSTALRWPI